MRVARQETPGEDAGLRPPLHSIERLYVQGIAFLGQDRSGLTREVGVELTKRFGSGTTIDEPFQLR